MERSLGAFSEHHAEAGALLLAAIGDTPEARAATAREAARDVLAEAMHPPDPAFDPLWLDDVRWSAELVAFGLLPHVPGEGGAANIPERLDHLLATVFLLLPVGLALTTLPASRLPPHDACDHLCGLLFDSAAVWDDSLRQAGDDWRERRDEATIPLGDRIVAYSKMVFHGLDAETIEKIEKCRIDPKTFFRPSRE